MIEPDHSQQRRAQFLLLLVVFIWATNYAVAKTAIAKLDMFLFNSLRFIVAASVLGLLFFSRSHWVKVERSDWGKILQAGVIANVFYQIAFVVGLKLTTAGNAAVLMSTSPLWTVLVSAKLHKERIQPNMWIGMSLSLAGVLMIIAGSGKKLEFGGQEIIGDLICITSALLWAFNTNLQKPLLVHYSPLHLSFVMVSVGAVGLSIVAIPSAITLEWSSIGWEYWAATIISGALSIGIGNAWWSHGVQQLGPARTGSFSNLVPVIALVTSFLTLHENIYLIQFIGSAFTIAGVWLARR